MRNKLIATVVLLSSVNALADNLGKKIERAYCQEKARTQVKKFEKNNPGMLKRLSDYQVELWRMNEMEQLRKVAIDQVKQIEKENGRNMTVESFFASDKPMNERMLDRRPETHVLMGVAMNDIVASDRVTVQFENEHASFWEEKVKTFDAESRVWYDHGHSTEDKLVLSVDIDRSEESCRFEEVPHLEVHQNWDQAIAAYERNMLKHGELAQQGLPSDWVEKEYEVEGFYAKNINGKGHRRECEYHPVATHGKVKVIVTKNADGSFNYDTEIGETELVRRYRDRYDKDLAARSEHLAEIGFVERFNGTPDNRIKNEGALKEYVAKTQAQYDEYFERKIGKGCVKALRKGDGHSFGYRRKDTQEVSQRHAVVIEGLNRGIASTENDKEDQNTVTGQEAQANAKSSKSVN